MTSNGERNNVHIARHAFDGHPETFWERVDVSKHVVMVGACFPFSVLFKVIFSPTAESFGVLAKLSPGPLWGSYPARFWQVPRFQVRVSSKGSGRFRGSK